MNDPMETSINHLLPLYKILCRLSIILRIKSEVSVLHDLATYQSLQPHFSSCCSSHPQDSDGHHQDKCVSNSKSCTFASLYPGGFSLLLSTWLILLFHSILFFQIMLSSKRAYLTILFKITLYLHPIKSFYTSCGKDSDAGRDCGQEEKGRI